MYLYEHETHLILYNHLKLLFLISFKITGLSFNENLNETFERLPTANIKNDEELSYLSNSFNELKTSILYKKYRNNVP